LLKCCHRPDLRCQFGRIPEAGGPGQFNQTFDYLVVHAALDEQTRAGDAGLTRGCKYPGNCPFDRVLQIGIVENDVG
jgi:hypothetical protein